MKTRKMTQKMILGETDISNYVRAPNLITHEKKESLKRLVSEIEHNTLNVEQLPLNLLRIELAEYPSINPEFLRMHNTINYNGQQIQMPRFSVYKRSERGFDDFSINIRAKIETTQHFFSSPTIDYYDVTLTINNGGLHKILENPLLESLGAEESRFRASPESGKKYEIGERQRLALDFDGDIYKDLTEVRLITQFNGIIPQNTKAKLAEAKHVFGEQLYLIAETKPEQWQIKEIVTDPLLVGIFNDRCYLIDHFNTTSLEDYVRKEFTS